MYNCDVAYLMPINVSSFYIWIHLDNLLITKIVYFRYIFIWSGVLLWTASKLQCQWSLQEYMWGQDRKIWVDVSALVAN